MMQDVLNTQELRDANVANFENNLSQLVPLLDKAFLRVCAALEAMGQTQLVKFGVERALQNLAITATGEDLKNIGLEKDVIKNPAVATVLTATLPGTDGVVVKIRTPFTGAANGMRYYTDAAYTITGGIATMSLTAEEVGVAGNLNVSDTLSIGTQIAGAESTATVTEITTTGAEEEDQEDFRARILFAMRSSSGGSNATDHKTWAEAVSGVLTAFPYAGSPLGPIYSTPSERTVYIESTTDIDPDGIPPESLLEDVREALNTDPETGLARYVLGITDETLYVEPIVRTQFEVTITDLIVDESFETQLKEDMSTALTLYFLSLNPFIIGIDVETEKNDLITKLTISRIVQGILETVGASATLVTFNIGGDPALDSYELAFGEKAKLGVITYA